MIDAVTAPYAALILRLALGALFLAHGLLKLLVFKPAGTVGYFKSLGLPGELAYVTMAAELGGAFALIVGISRVLGRGTGRAVSARRWRVDLAGFSETVLTVCGDAAGLRHRYDCCTGTKLHRHTATNQARRFL
jgi:hypothetical protein